MGKRLEVTPGERYGRLTVVKEVERTNKGKRQFLCQCDCGSETTVRLDHLKGQRVVSCGCLKKERAENLNKKHGLVFISGHMNRMYKIWSCMRQRCSNPNYDRFRDYGGRGIEVCPEWDNDFLAFREWALNNGYSDELTIDRIDVCGNYEPSNCRWANGVTQQNNRRNNLRITYQGETHTMADWARITGLNYDKLRQRYRKGLPLEQVFFNGDLRLSQMGR